MEELKVADSELGVEEEEEVMSGVSRPRYDTSYSDDPESVIREITDMQSQERCYGDGLRSEVQFVWDVEDEDPPRGATSAAHRPITNPSKDSTKLNGSFYCLVMVMCSEIVYT